jgi:hypothetical protein
VNSYAIPPACPGSLRAPRLSLAGTPGATRTQGLAGAPIRYAQRTTSCYLYPGKAPRDPHDAHSCESCRQTVSIGRRGTFAGRVGNEAEPGRGSWALLRNRFRATNTGPARVSRRKRMEGDFSGEDREGAGCQCSGPLPAQSRLEGLLLLTAIGGAKAQEGQYVGRRRRREVECAPIGRLLPPKKHAPGASGYFPNGCSTMLGELPLSQTPGHHFRRGPYLEADLWRVHVGHAPQMRGS